MLEGKKFSVSEWEEILACVSTESTVQAHFYFRRHAVMHTYKHVDRDTEDTT